MEDLHHVFCQCERAKIIWFSSPLGINFEKIHEQFQDWLIHYILSITLWYCWFNFIHYSIWWANNKLCFEGKLLEVHDIIKILGEMLLIFKQIQQPKSHQHPWIWVVHLYLALPLGYLLPRVVLKWILLEQVLWMVGGAIGVVIRDHSVLLFATATWSFLGPPDSFLAEAILGKNMPWRLDGNWGIGAVIRDHSNLLFATATWPFLGPLDPFLVEAIGQKYALT